MIAVLGAELIRRGQAPSAGSVSAVSTLVSRTAQIEPGHGNAPGQVDQTDALASEAEHTEQLDEAITGLQPTVRPSTTRARTKKAPLLPAVAVSSGVLGLALAPAFGAGIVPAIAAVVCGHSAKHRPLAKQGTVMTGLVLGYLGIGLSVVMGTIAATPVIRALLISVGFLLPD